jgi:anionic cell wall polymer biosynthesis LytR-Cps2A-Psr (LCP) family protein
LTLQVVKELTGLQINHIVNVDFLGFVRCRLRDRLRLRRRRPPLLPLQTSACRRPEQYSEINVQPGYQLMCGKRALEYVRYRHTDTDIVRAARQQDFLSAARARVPIADLVLVATI